MGEREEESTLKRLILYGTALAATFSMLLLLVNVYIFGEVTVAEPSQPLLVTEILLLAIGTVLILKRYHKTLTTKNYAIVIIGLISSLTLASTCPAVYANVINNNPHFNQDEEQFYDQTSSAFHDAGWTVHWCRWTHHDGAPDAGWLRWYTSGELETHIDWTSDLWTCVHLKVTPSFTAPNGWTIEDQPQATFRGSWKLVDKQNSGCSGWWKVIAETWWRVNSTVNGKSKVRNLVLHNTLLQSAFSIETSVRATDDQLTIFNYEHGYYMDHHNWRSFEHSLKFQLLLAEQRLEDEFTTVEFDYRDATFNTFTWGPEVPYASKADLTAKISYLAVELEPGGAPGGTHMKTMVKDTFIVFYVMLVALPIIYLQYRKRGKR